MRAGACGLLWAVLACLLGCHAEAPSRAVGVLSFTRESPVNAFVERELIKYAEGRGVRAVWVDEDDFEPDLPRKENVLRALYRLLEEERIEALILRQANPKYAEILRQADPKYADLSILKIRERGAPVLFLDTLPPDLAVDGFVTVDYRSAGREAAEYALQQAHRRRRRDQRNLRSTIGPLLNAVVVEGPRGSEEGRLAAAGIYSVLDGDPNVRIVARYSPKDPSDAFRFVSYELHKYADNIQVLLSTDPKLGSAAVFAADARGSAADIESAGVGSSRESSRRIRSGEHDLDIDTMPAAAAQRALEVALQLVDDENPPPDAFTRQGPLLTPTYYAPRRRINIDNVSEMFAIWPNLAEE